MNASNWKYNHKTESVEITMDTGDIVVIPKDTFINVINIMPEFDDEYQIRELLEKLWAIKQRRLMLYEELDNEVQKLRILHADIRKSLSTAKSKMEVYRLSAQTKDLAAEKVLLGEKREIIKLLNVQEANLKGQLAKIIVGKGNQ